MQLIFVQCHYFTVGPPKITHSSSATVSFEGRKVQLTCNATNDVDAVRPLQIKWYNSKGKQVQIANKNVLVYNNTNNVTGEMQSVLLFDPVNHTDTAMYTCRAYNHPQCYSEDKVNLTVECELFTVYKVYHEAMSLLLWTVCIKYVVIAIMIVKVIWALFRFQHMCK